MRKMRMRAPDDPGTQGPKFIRLSAQLVVYEFSALDTWVEERAAQGQLRHQSDGTA